MLQGVWFTSIAGNEGLNKEYSAEEREKFRNDPDALLEHSKFIENQVNGIWGAFYSNSFMQGEAQKMLKAHMADWIKNERLLNGACLPPIHLCMVLLLEYIQSC